MFLGSRPGMDSWSISDIVISVPNYADVGLQLEELKRAADAINQKTLVASAGTDRDIDAAVATLVQNGADALLVANDPFFNSHHKQLVALAARYALPTSYHVREAVVSGGLMSYGASFADGYRQAGIYTGRILKGEKPANRRFSSPPNSSSCSILRPPRLSASKSLQHSSRSPTR